MIPLLRLGSANRNSGSDDSDVRLTRNEPSKSQKKWAKSGPIRTLLYPNGCVVPHDSESC